MAVDWPALSTSTVHRIFAGYGQFGEDTSGLASGFHFHEGVDIEAAGGTAVFATEDGEIVEAENRPASSYGHFLTITRSVSTATALGYVHINIGINPATGSPWTCGDSIHRGDVLGTVATTPGIYHHLHLEMDSNADGFANCSPTATSVAALAGDPLEILSPAADATKPTIEDVLFRDGVQEGVAAATYRTDVIASRNVLFGNIDIIAKAHDNLAGFDSRLGLHKVGFELLGGARAIAEQALAHFTGTFISPPGSFNKFRDPDLTQVIYESDNTAASNQDLAAGVANDSFYIITNKGTGVLSLSDRDRYWNTDVRDVSGAQWNDLDVVNNRARHAGEAFFPDGEYALRVFAEDEKGATNRTTLDKPITIDNFRPFLRKVEIKTLSGVLHFFEEWLFDGLNFIRSTTPKPFGPGKYVVQVEFSEPVVSPAAVLEGFGPLPVLESTDPPGQQRVFTATLDIESTGISDGDHDLLITAKDPADNDLLAVGPDDTTIDPAARLTRDASGVMQGVGGEAAITLSTDRTEPDVVIRDEDEEGIGPNGSTPDRNFFVDAADASGIVSISVTGFDELTYEGDSDERGTFEDADIGLVQVVVKDRAGNERRRNFYIFEEAAVAGDEAAPEIQNELFLVEDSFGGLPSIDYVAPLADGSRFVVGGAARVLKISAAGDTLLDTNFGDSPVIGFAADTMTGVGYLAVTDIADPFEPTPALLRIGPGSGPEFADLPVDTGAGFAFGGGGVAYDAARGRIYVAYSVFVLAEGRYTPMIAAYDTDFNLIASRRFQPDADGHVFPEGGVTVDDNGDVWLVGSHSPDNEPKRLYTIHYGPNLVGGSVTNTETTFTESILMYAGPKSDGVEVVAAIGEKRDTQDTIFARGSNGGLGGAFVFPDVSPFHRIPIRDGVFYVHTKDGDQGPLKLAKLNAQTKFAWSPSYLEFYPEWEMSAMAAPTTTQLHLAVSAYDPEFDRFELGLLLLAPPGPPVAFNSPDEKATVVSNVPNTEIFPVPLDDETDARATVPEMGLAMASEIYEIQPSPRTLSVPATLSIDFDPTGVDLASVEIHRWNGDVWEAGPISGQTVTDNPNGTKRISGFLNTFSIYAVLYDAVGDATPPVTTISFSTPSFVSSGTLVAVGTRSSVTLSAEDFSASSAPISGLATTYYSVDAPTQPVTAYTGPFMLPAGEHTIYFHSKDVAGNAEAVSSRTVTAFDGPFVGSVSASTGPIGVPVVVRGFNFGSWSPPRTSLAFGVSTAPVSIWNDAQVTATVPGISSGTYDLTLTALQNGSTVAVLAGSFTVLTPEIFAVAPSSGPIGAYFTLSGTAFGPYGGANTRVLLGGATTPVSVWNDSTITATVPGALAPGAYELAVERRTSDGGLALSNTVYFQVSELVIAALTPSTGPIGVPFTLSGSGFGAYAGANTQVLFGETSAAISVWNDATISGTVPALSTSAYAVVVKRVQGSGVQLSNASTFTLTALELTPPTPSTGPIGTVFTLTGSGFGPYAGVNTRVLLGGTTTPVSVWNDTTIKGTVPGLVPTGVQPLVIERATGSGLERSNTVYFEVTGQGISAINPSTGPVGISFTLVGSGFGAYAGVNTQVLFGQTTAAISVWNDTSITGTIPALATGTYDVVVERIQGAGTSLSNAASFTLTELILAVPVPSSAPAGAPFTLTGTGFGAYAGANTRLLLGGATVPVSVWNDTTITGTVLALTPGSQTLWIERKGTGGLQASNTVYFEILAPSVGSLSPSTGPIGIPFTITGSGFGPYSGANTQVLFGSTPAPISIWNDSTIKGTVPALSTATYDVVVQRIQGGVPSVSGISAFTVLLPEVAAMTPSSAPIGAPFTITGAAFGPYAGTNTRVKFNGIAAPISVWNDATISGTVPGAVAVGSAAVVVERAVGASVAQSAEQSFLVLQPTVSTITPSFGPAGTVVTLTGYGFGPYAGAATRLLVGGSTVAVSVWNNTTIRWTVPSSLTDGTYAVVVLRQPSGGSVQSEGVDFTIGTGYGGASFGFSSQSSLAARPDTHFEGGLNLSSDEGGRVETPAKAAVEVPPNALEANTEITLKRLHQDGLRSRAAESAKVSAAGEAIEFGPEGTQFATPVTIELPYDPALTGDESTLAVHYYDPLRRVWEQLPSEVDRARRVVKAKTAHFSIYQPMGLAPTTAAQDEFYFRDLYAFPNPSRGNAAVTFRIQPGLADTIEVRVYDLAGRKIHSSSDFTFRGALDDGNGKGAQNTYDHTWDVSGVGSGVYTYVIRASRAGQKPISRSGKAAVIK